MQMRKGTQRENCLQTLFGIHSKRLMAAVTSRSHPQYTYWLFRRAVTHPRHRNHHQLIERRKLQRLINRYFGGYKSEYKSRGIMGGCTVKFLPLSDAKRTPEGRMERYTFCFLQVQVGDVTVGARAPPGVRTRKLVRFFRI